MTLLIDIGQPDWMRDEDLRDQLTPMLPDVAIHCGPPDGVMEDVLMLAVSRLRPQIARNLPNLQLVQKLGAGVETIVNSADLPTSVRVTRLKPDTPAQEIAEFCLAYVLRDQRNLLQHAADAANRTWNSFAPKKTADATVGVLGLGHIGGRTARLFASLGYRTLGWSRSVKKIDGVECRHGSDALPDLLAECDYVASILPSTADTTDLFDAKMLAHMKPGSMLINAGRGTLIVDDDLTRALDGGKPAHAVLDVFRQEPLPPEHPFWGDARITITPHVSGWHLDGGLQDVAENYRRLIDGRPLLHGVDRMAGY